MHKPFLCYIFICSRCLWPDLLKKEIRYWPACVEHEERCHIDQKRSPLALNLSASAAVVAGKVLNTDLRHYLSLQFQKGSLDHKLQQIIRDNLYLRTIPCKYSTPDYTFNTLTSSCEKKMMRSLTCFQSVQALCDVGNT